MAQDKRQMVLFSGGGWHYRGHKGFLMDEWLLALTGKSRPKVCLLATPQGDNPDQLAAIFKALQSRAELSWASMFSPLPPGQDASDNLLNADLIYIPGGYAQATVGCWRAASWDVVLREAWENGVILAGMCAGGMSFTRQYANRWMHKPGVGEGLGFLDISLTVHAQHPLYEPVGSIFRHGIRDGLIVAGYQLQDGFAARFRGSDLVECITCDPPDASGWFLEPTDDNEQKIIEHQLYAESLESRLRLALPFASEEFEFAMRELSPRERQTRLRRRLNPRRNPLDGPEHITGSIASPLDADATREPLPDEGAMPVIGDIVANEAALSIG
jgi:dipeptidase E